MPAIKLRATCRDKKGNILSIGENSYKKTHPLMAYFGKKVGHHPSRIFLHAEIDAILKARDKRIHSIFIERYGKDGRPLLAAPCPICQEALRAFNISIVSYTVGE